MTTMRSARSMREVETPRNQSSLLSLTLILPSFKAHLVLNQDYSGSQFNCWQTILQVRMQGQAGWLRGWRRPHSRDRRKPQICTAPHPWHIIGESPLISMKEVTSRGCRRWPWQQPGWWRAKRSPWQSSPYPGVPQLHAHSQAFSWRHLKYYFKIHEFLLFWGVWGDWVLRRCLSQFDLSLLVVSTYAVINTSFSFKGNFRRTLKPKICFSFQPCCSNLLIWMTMCLYMKRMNRYAMPRHRWPRPTSIDQTHHRRAASYLTHPQQQVQQKQEQQQQEQQQQQQQQQ